MKNFKLACVLFLGLSLINCRNNEEGVAQNSEMTVKIHDDYAMRPDDAKTYPEFAAQFHNKKFDFSANNTAEGSYWTENNGQIKVFLRNVLPNNRENILTLSFDKNAGNNYQFSTDQLLSLMTSESQELNLIPSATGSKGSVSLLSAPKTATVDLKIVDGKLSGSIINLKNSINYSQTYLYDGTVPQGFFISGLLRNNSYRTYTFDLKFLPKK